MIVAADLIFIVVLAFLLLLMITMLTHVILRVPWVPSTRAAAQKMLEAARLKRGEKIYDLGCGDGRLLFAAEKKYGVRGVGYEIAALLYLAARVWAVLRRSRAQIRFQNFFNANLKDANVIFCYLFPNIMPQLMKKIRRECRKGTRVISNTFRIKGWRPVHVLPKDGKTPAVYIYKV